MGLGYFIPDEVTSNVAVAKEYLSLQKEVRPETIYSNQFVGTVKLSSAEWDQVQQSVRSYVIW
jgi:hypothetical protein